MKIFISWSGKKSREVAIAIRDWLPGVINSVEPFVSSKDLQAGTRWQQEVAQQLEATDFGIICVTKSNQSAPWLNFEAGALAKAVDVSRVIPLAIDLKPSDIEQPLGQFQAQPLSSEGMAEVVRCINANLEAPLADGLLAKSLEKWWPDLSAVVEAIPDETRGGKGKRGERSERELLEEVLNTVRSLSRAATSDPFKGGMDHSRGAQGRVQSMMDEFVPGSRVLFSSSRGAIGVRPPPGETVPDDVRLAVEEIARDHGLDVDWFSKRRVIRKPSRDDEV